jgi:hypothetical protein
MPHVQQHELFIRAALEGRRDHVYQAAMFDPLTAATLTLDKIKEMCDELIAAHGDLLPRFDSPRSLVPTSGKQFGVVDAKALHRSWDTAQERAEDEYIKHWKVLGPFKIGTRAQTSLDFPTAFDAAFAKSRDGAVDTSAVCKDADGTVLQWVDATVEKHGFVNFDRIIGRHEFAIAYACAVIESVHARDCVLGFGSDDGIRVWLNGQEIHTREAHRGYVANADQVDAHLNAGKNHLLLKIDNFTAGWGCGAAVPPANF